MDHLTSRFRRLKKDKGKEKEKEDDKGPAGVQNDAHSSAPADNPRPGMLAPPLVGNGLPGSSLQSLTTTPATTPPGSSHSSRSFLHASRFHSQFPLRALGFPSGGHSNSGRSPPAPINIPSIPVPTLIPTPPIQSPNLPADNATEPDMNPAQRSPPVGNGRPARGPKPRMPFFLALNDSIILNKFTDLVWNERIRYQKANLNTEPGHPFELITNPEAKILDRYVNIQPWGNNRIKLHVPPGKPDYINASPIVVRSPARPGDQPPLRYIAMQGPKENTVDHVWRMVAQQLEAPAVIVMLTDTYEGHNEKCYPYFPPNHEFTIQIDDEFGDGFHGRVDCNGYEELCDGAIQLRKLRLRVNGRNDMLVWHLHYRKWPDFGVPRPDDWDSFFELMKLSRHLNNNRDGVPRIIHCSAGVGRTGTFIALETLMRDVDLGYMDRLDPRFTDNNDDLVYATVNNLREQRRQMVQADVQYHFIYQVLRHHWLARCANLEKQARREDGGDTRRTTRSAVASPGQHRPGMPYPTTQRPSNSSQSTSTRSARRAPREPLVLIESDVSSSDESAAGGARLR